MKKTALLFIITCFLSCSSDDNDNDDTIDLDLLFGQWYNVGLCQDQNSLLLNSNKTYTGFSSGAISCNDPAPDTYRAMGTFNINGDFIVYSQMSIELVIDGTDNSVLEIPDPNVKYEVTNLTETSLSIRVFREIDDTITEELGTFNYEH